MTSSPEVIPVSEPLLDGRESEYVLDCVASGWISSAGEYITRFEREWAAYCGRRFGVAVSSGTTALELAVSSLGLPEDAEVILPSFTIVSCLEAVLRSGLRPVLVDCDPRTFCVDPAAVERRIGPRTAAVLPVHIYGHPAPMEPLLDLASRHGLRVIEDAAEAHGAECRVGGSWRRCGSFGDVSCFSFYANKSVTCGEGGMVLTDDAELAETLRSRRNLCFGRDRRFVHEGRGWNFRMTNLQAAVGCAQIERVDRLIARRREIGAVYDDGLRGLPIATPHREEWARPSLWMYAVVLDDAVPFDAVELARRLHERGVETRPFFAGMHEQPIYRALGLFAGEELPVTERIARRGLYLPTGQALRDDQVRAVVDAMTEVLA